MKAGVLAVALLGACGHGESPPDGSADGMPDVEEATCETLPVCAMADGGGVISVRSCGPTLHHEQLCKTLQCATCMPTFSFGPPTVWGCKIVADPKMGPDAICVKSCDECSP